MLLTKFPYQDLFVKLSKDDGSVVITPNQRLSSFLNKHYDKYQLHLAKQYWKTQIIVPFFTFIENLWKDYNYNFKLTKPLLLNSFQAKLLWENIIKTSKQGHTLLDVNETAKLSKSAWELIKEWQIDIQSLEFNETRDYQAFKTWALQFKKACGNKWIDSASLLPVITDLIDDHKIVLPNNLYVVGFNDYSPAFLTFLNVCTKRGTHIIKYELKNYNKTVKRINLETEEDEIITGARFIKQKKIENKDATFAFIVPTLEIKRNRILQLFSQVFKKEADGLIFNISVGKMLAQFPIIHSAINFLLTFNIEMNTDDFISLITSPFIGESEKELFSRATFGNIICEKNIKQINLKNLIQDNGYILHSHFIRLCPKLFKRLNKLLGSLEAEVEQFKSHYEWCTFINSLLFNLAWPGERSLSSEEHQAVFAWQECLQSCATLDVIRNNVSYEEVLHNLQALLNETSFQPKTPEAPIQVLGTLEAASLAFDYVWMCGMDETTWPSPIKPNPFIPRSIQTSLSMPHATHQREYDYSESIIKQITNANPHVIFSYAEKKDDYTVAESSLIKQYPVVGMEELSIAHYISPSMQIFSNRKFDLINDHLAPVITNETTINGGTYILKLQALCPFRAFAEGRLQAYFIKPPTPGLNKKEKGIIIHKTLELFWNEIKTHENLINLSQERENLILTEAIEHALKFYQSYHPHIQHYFHIEKDRVRNIISEWIRFEKLRDPFSVICHEEKTSIKIGNLTLNVRIDRIDQLSNGKKFIIDYKTSPYVEVRSWFGERLDEPQLPCYTLQHDSATSAIAYAQIVPGNYCFKGIGDDHITMDGIKNFPIKNFEESATNWQEQINEWSRHLLTLCNMFCDGIAIVSPKLADTTCTLCDLKCLCRIYETL